MILAMVVREAMFTCAKPDLALSLTLSLIGQTILIRKRFRALCRLLYGVP